MSTQQAPSRRLSDEYQAVLRWYPKRWRQQHESVVLGMLLEDAERRGLTELPIADRQLLIASGLRERFFSFEKVPLFNTLSLILGVGFSLFYCFVTAWAPSAHVAGMIGPFANPAVITGSLLVLATAAALLNVGRTSVMLARAALMSDLLLLIGAQLWNWLGPSVWSSLIFAVFAILGSVRGFRIAR